MNNTYISFYLKEGKVHIPTVTLRDIGSPPYVRFLLNEDGSSMVLEPYDHKAFPSMRVPKKIYAEQYAGGRMEFRCMALCRIMSGRFGWDTQSSYRVPGRLISKQRLVLLDVTGAEMIEAQR